MELALAWTTKKHRKKTTQNATLSMDIESHETDGLLKKRAPKRQGLAFKLAILLCGLKLLLVTNMAWRDGVRRERVVRDDCRLRTRRPDRPEQLPGGPRRGPGHSSSAWREVGFLRNIREARGVAGVRRGTDHRSVACG